MESPLVSRLCNETTPFHTRFDSGRMPFASTVGSKAEASNAETLPTRRSIDRP
jgi:hypothetical protein